MRSKGEGSIVYNEKKEMWIGALLYNGKRKYFYSKKKGKRKEVVDKMEAWKRAHNKEDLTSKTLTLGERMDEWLVVIKKPDLKPSSYDRLESIIKCQVKPRIGDYTLDEITDTLIKTELLDAIADDGLGISSQKKAYNAVHAYLDYAVYKQLLKFNPMGMMKPPKPQDYQDAVEEDTDENAADVAAEGDVKPLDDAERKLLREWAGYRWKRSGDLRYPTGAGFVFIMNTGLRMGEALALKWSDIDFDRSVVKVTKNMVVIKNRNDSEKKQRVVIQNTTKSKKSNREVPLNKEALQSLATLRGTPGASENGYVIHTKIGKPVLPRSFQQSLDLLCKAAGIRKIGVHTLRHTYATRLYEKGADVKVISELLGHRSVDITYRIYIHLFEQTKVAAVQALDLD